ncbi:membrane-spanning 4-domains subfamily A member 8-like isoform X2 [Stigmatopora nigra]
MTGASQTSKMSDKSVATTTMASNQTRGRDKGPRSCCCRPCCPIRGGVLAVLGTIQILVGVANLGLGAGRTRTRPGDFASLGAAYWIGVTFITAGILSLLSGNCPCPCCCAALTLTANVVCAIVSVVAVVLYALDLAALSVTFFCGDWNVNDGCRDAASYALKLTRGMDITLIVLAILVLCVSISASVFAVMPLQSEDDEEKSQE